MINSHSKGSLAILWMSLFGATACVKHVPVTGAEAYQTCSILPVNTWAKQDPNHVMCIPNTAFATEPERVVFYFENAPSSLMQGGIKLSTSPEFMPGTCYLVKDREIERTNLLDEVKAHGLPLPPAKFDYEIWDDIRILEGDSGYSHNFVEVIRAGNSVWVTTSLCSPS